MWWRLRAGINHVPDSSRKSGYRLVGDCTDEAYRKASRYTPVPGGIGTPTQHTHDTHTTHTQPLTVCVVCVVQVP